MRRVKLLLLILSLKQFLRMLKRDHLIRGKEREILTLLILMDTWGPGQNTRMRRQCQDPVMRMLRTWRNILRRNRRKERQKRKYLWKKNPCFTSKTQRTIRAGPTLISHKILGLILRQQNLHTSASFRKDKFTPGPVIPRVCQLSDGFPHLLILFSLVAWTIR